MESTRYDEDLGMDVVFCGDPKGRVQCEVAGWVKDGETRMFAFRGASFEEAASWFEGLLRQGFAGEMPTAVDLDALARDEENSHRIWRDGRFVIREGKL